MAKHKKKVGYVQGMNYIAATLLYHVQEWMAFAIIDMLMKKKRLIKLF